MKLASPAAAADPPELPVPGTDNALREHWFSPLWPPAMHDRGGPGALAPRWPRGSAASGTSRTPFSGVTLLSGGAFAADQHQRAGPHVTLSRLAFS